MRGVCRDCYRAGPAELAYRQAVRDIDRELGYSVFIPRRKRKRIEGFLTHGDARARAYAAHVIERDAEARRESARLRDEDEEAAIEAMVAFYEAVPDPPPEAMVAFYEAVPDSPPEAVSYADRFADNPGFGAPPGFGVPPDFEDDLPF